MKSNISDLIEAATAHASRATEIAMRLRRDVDLLTDMHLELKVLVETLAILGATAEHKVLPPTALSVHLTARLLRIEQVIDRLGVSRAHIWQMVKDGRFPKPRRISSRAVAWLESDVHAWVENRPAFDSRTEKRKLNRRSPHTNTDSE